MTIKIQRTFLRGNEETVEEFDFLSNDGLKLYFRVPAYRFTKEKLQDLEERLNFLVTLMGGKIT